MDEKTLQRLADRDAIHDVLMRYSRGVDRHDLAALKSCYHEDSYDDHGHFKGNGHDFADYILGSLAQRTHHTSHTVLNHVIDMDDKDPDRAHAESYGVAYLRRTDPQGEEWLDLFAGRYVDVFSRRAGVFTVLFAIGRLPGWIAHWQEMNNDRSTKIGRPQQLYVGEPRRDWPRG